MNHTQTTEIRDAIREWAIAYRASYDAAVSQLRADPEFQEWARKTIEESAGRAVQWDEQSCVDLALRHSDWEAPAFPKAATPWWAVEVDAGMTLSGETTVLFHGREHSTRPSVRMTWGICVVTEQGRGGDSSAEIGDYAWIDGRPTLAEVRVEDLEGWEQVHELAQAIEAAAVEMREATERPVVAASDSGVRNVHA